MKSMPFRLPALLLLVATASCGCRPEPAAPTEASEEAASAPVAQARAFADTFLQLDAQGARAQQAMMLSPPLRAALDRALAANQRIAAGQPDEKSPMAEWSYFGVVDRWRPGPLAVREIDAQRAEVQVPLLVEGADAPAVVVLQLVRSDERWWLDDIQPADNPGEGLRKGLDTVR